jgi:hypothetical protein
MQTGFLLWWKALNFSNKRLLLLVGNYPVRQLFLYEKDFVYCGTAVFILTCDTVC